MGRRPRAPLEGVVFALAVAALVVSLLVLLSPRAEVFRRGDVEGARPRRATHDSPLLRLEGPNAFPGSSAYPAIRWFEGVLTAGECREIVRMARPGLERSTLGPAREVGEARTSSQAWLALDATPAVARVVSQLAQLTGLSPACFEDLQVLEYGVGAEYRAHHDSCNPDTGDYDECVAEEAREGWGRRVYTFFMYLNDGFEGGGTDFPRLGVTLTPKRGCAALWANLRADEEGHAEDSFHGGMPVLSGTKYAANLWVRQRPRASAA